MASHPGPLRPWWQAKDVKRMGERGDVRGLQRLLDQDKRTSLSSVDSRRTFRLMAFDAARFGHTAMVKHLCEERGVPLQSTQEDEWPAEAFLHFEGDIDTRAYNSTISPLMGALIGKQEELALSLLAVAGRELDLQQRVSQGYTLLHYHYACVQGLLRVVEALIVTYGADMQARDDNNEMPICIAAKLCYIPIVNFLLERYRDMGPAKLREALEGPCKKEGGLPEPLLYHVPVPLFRAQAGTPSTEAQVVMLRHLVRDWRADIWQCIKSGPECPGDSLLVHQAALGCNMPVLAFYLTECGMPVDTATALSKMSIIQTACCILYTKEAEVLRLVKWLVETKHADLQNFEGTSPAKFASAHGLEKVAAYLTYGDRQEQANKAEADLLAMLNAEEEGAMKEKQHEPGHQKKSKSKKKKTTAQEEGQGGGFNDHGPEPQVLIDKEGEFKPREGLEEEQHYETKPGASETPATALTAGLQGLTIKEATANKSEADDEQAFVLLNAPEEFVCPLTHELLTDPVVAACGYSYQRKAFEEWVAQCRATGLHLTSPKTGARMASHMVVNRLLKSQVEEYIEARRRAWRLQKEEEGSMAGGGGEGCMKGCWRGGV